MSDGGASFRPRRAWQPGDETEKTIASDDTPGPNSSAPRRGPREQDSTPQVPDSVRSEGSVEETGRETPVNPFARPGSNAADAPAPNASAAPPRQTQQSATPIPAPVLPASASASPATAPRRSALSSTTPVEAEPLSAGTPDWFTAHRSTLGLWALGGFIAALVIALLTFFVVRNARPAPTPSETPASPSTSVSPGAEAATTEDLLRPAELEKIAATAWTATDTTTLASEHSGRGACLSTEAPAVNPTFSLQRTLATSDEDRTAALHRIDTFAEVKDAEAEFDSRSRALSNCSEVPTYISSASTVTGLSEEAFQVTVVYQDQDSQYHTVLLTRSGAALQLLDVSRIGKPVEAALLATTLERPQASLSKFQDAPAPANIAAKATVVPPATPPGWLAPADLPRIRPGFGSWTKQDPTALSGKGIGCEDMTLATQSGPTAREQATYFLGQDDKTPKTFGIDEMMFTFANESDASGFAKKLSDNIASCKTRVNTATVNELDEVSGTGAGGAAVSSRIFSVKQATSKSTSVPYQLIVSTAKNRVAYTLVTVSEDYKFSDAQLAALGLRIPIRATQFN